MHNKLPYTYDGPAYPKGNGNIPEWLIYILILSAAAVFVVSIN